MDDLRIPLKTIERRAASAATKRGHVAGPFEETSAPTARGETVAAGRSVCTKCGGTIWALANGETSVPRLCRSA